MVSTTEMAAGYGRWSRAYYSRPPLWTDGNNNNRRTQTYRDSRGPYTRTHATYLTES